MGKGRSTICGRYRATVSPKTIIFSCRPMRRSLALKWPTGLTLSQIHSCLNLLTLLMTTAEGKGCTANNATTPTRTNPTILKPKRFKRDNHVPLASSGSIRQITKNHIHRIIWQRFHNFKAITQEYISSHSPPSRLLSRYSDAATISPIAHYLSAKLLRKTSGEMLARKSSKCAR